MSAASWRQTISLLGIRPAVHPAKSLVKLCVSLRVPCRCVHIAQSQTTSVPLSMDVSDLVRSVPQINGDGPFPRAPKFEVIGSPSSLLSVALPASATLYTRRGTLVGVNGNLENVTSTLSILNPSIRAFTGIPFLYQKITSTTPLTALITSRSSMITTFAVVTLDGRIDWTIAQRNALLAWTGSTLTLKPKLVPRFSLTRWGNTVLSGRGELALVGKGQIYQISLQEGEEFVCHPSNILAYTSAEHGAKPAPYRLRHSRLRIQIPSWARSDSLSKAVQNFRQTSFAQFVTKYYFKVKTFIRNSIWGDDLFVKFSGPSTILIQSRSTKLSDIIPASEMREIAEIEPSLFSPKLISPDSENSAVSEEAKLEPKSMGQASVGGHLKVAVVENGKVTFKSVDSFKDFIK
ncbi:altered inheritance of mitochondria protein 24 [Dipodascopsis uninucleata]